MANETNAITKFENWCTTKHETVEYSIKWTIENFSNFNEDVGQYLASDVFTSEKDNSKAWQLRLYPNGCVENCSNIVSIFVHLARGDSINAKYTFEVLNSANKALKTYTSTGIRKFNNDNWGWSMFVERKSLLNHLLADDKLIVICKILAFVGKIVSSGTTKFNDELPIPDRQILGLSEDLGKLFDAQMFTDCVLTAENEEMAIHKTLLISRSPVFRAMFEHDTEERRTNRIIINDVEFDVLKETVRFMYTGEAPILPKMADKLLAAANKYALTDLKTLCEKALAKDLMPENVFDVLALADLHNADHLKRRATEFMNENIDDVITFHLETCQNRNYDRNVSNERHQKTLFARFLQTIGACFRRK